MNKICVIGLGRFGLALAERLAADGLEVLAIDRSQEIIEQIKDKNEDQDFFSAIKICKKKRIGPSRQEDNRPLFYKKDIGVLARSGFDFEVSRRVMDLDKDEYLKIINLL